MQIPFELRMEIFRLLSLKDLFSMALTCKQAQKDAIEVLRDEEFIYEDVEISEKSSPGYRRSSLFEKEACYEPWVIEFENSNITPVFSTTFNIYKFIEIFGPHLEYLTVLIDIHKREKMLQFIYKFCQPTVKIKFWPSIERDVTHQRFQVVTYNLKHNSMEYRLFTKPHSSSRMEYRLFTKPYQTIHCAKIKFY